MVDFFQLVPPSLLRFLVPEQEHVDEGVLTTAGAGLTHGTSKLEETGSGAVETVPSTAGDASE